MWRSQTPPCASTQTRHCFPTLARCRCGASCSHAGHAAPGAVMLQHGDLSRRQQKRREDNMKAAIRQLIRNTFRKRGYLVAKYPSVGFQPVAVFDLAVQLL